MENILSNFQSDFRNGFNTKQCLKVMIETAKGVMDNSGYLNAILLTDLSKEFDYLLHDLIIAKLDSCGFKNELYV